MERRGRTAAREAKNLFAKNVHPSELALLAAEITPGHIATILRRVVKAGHGRSAMKLRAYLVAAFRRRARPRRTTQRPRAVGTSASARTPRR